MTTFTRRSLTLCIFAVAVVAIGFLAWRMLNRSFVSNEAHSIPFDGDSDQLHRTVIVATLDSPIPDGNSAIWSASFQLAWNRLKEDVVKEPIQLANAQTFADRLNRAEVTAADMETDSVYAAAGLAEDGIVKRIQKQMARMFPNVTAPQIDVPIDGAVAYAYLAASLKYQYPFFENHQRFVFADSTGKETSVGSFGIRETDDYAYHRLRNQVEILYRPAEPEDGEIQEFVLDPCKTSQPFQIVLARVKGKSTLAETLADVQQKIAAKTTPEFLLRFGACDVLLIPNMSWTIRHRFKELEGKDKLFLNRALEKRYLDKAMQTLQFRLNRGGAELTSESRVLVKPSPSYFCLNRPFLLFMKKRASARPFLVAWIANAELLQRR